MRVLVRSTISATFLSLLAQRANHQTGGCVAHDPTAGFLGRLERLFQPVDGWGEFRRGARKAAVVFVLYDAGGRWEVPFVRRRADLRDHPGQVALPGGGVHEGESAWEAGERAGPAAIAGPRGRLVPLGAGEPIYAAVS